MSDLDLSTDTANEVVWAMCEGCEVPIFRHYAWSHQGGTPPQDHEATPHQALDPDEEGIRLCLCGLPMSRNNHPDAGKPGNVLDVGSLYVCIPCLVDNRHRWATRAMEDEREMDRLRDVATEAFGLLREHREAHGTADEHQTSDPEMDPIAQSWRERRDGLIVRSESA